MKRAVTIVIMLAVLGGLVFAGLQPGVQQWVRKLPGIRVLWPLPVATWEDVLAEVMTEYPDVLGAVYHWTVEDDVGYAVYYIQPEAGTEGARTFMSHLFRAGRWLGLRRVVLVDTYQGEDGMMYPYAISMCEGDALAHFPESLDLEVIDAYMKERRPNGWSLNARIAVAYNPWQYAYLHFPVDDRPEVLGYVQDAVPLIDAAHAEYRSRSQ